VLLWVMMMVMMLAEGICDGAANAIITKEAH